MEHQTKQKQAVVIIYGIGNQFPMETAREFVENIKDENDILYSSPDREANFFETRRLSLSVKNTDFYEFYWANLVTEPRNTALLDWITKLLFSKEPSKRASRIVLYTRFFVFSVAIIFGIFILTDYFANGELLSYTAF